MHAHSNRGLKVRHGDIGCLETVKDGLTDGGWRNCDERTLMHLTLGMAVLFGGCDLEAAALEALADYLSCARTTAETSDSVPPKVSRRPRDEVEAQQTRQRLAAEQAAVARSTLVAMWARFCHQLAMIRPDPYRWPAYQQQYVAGIAAQIDDLSVQAGNAGTFDELEVIATSMNTQRILDEARILMALSDGEHTRLANLEATIALRSGSWDLR
jgi:hypothetical protein